MEPDQDGAFFLSGDPFVDTGVISICEWISQKNPEKIRTEDLSEMIDSLSEIYIQESWKKHCHGMLLPNHGKMFNPSLAKYSADEKKQLIEKYLQELVEASTPPAEYGNCLTCGRRSSVTKVYRSEYPMLGSGSTLNFFSYWTGGMSICAGCLFAVQVMPVGSYKVGGRILLLHSSNLKIMRYWVREPVKKAKSQFHFKTFDGLYTPEGYSNPQNTIFDILTGIIREYDEEWAEENPSITFYYFSGNNQQGDMQIIYFPSEVFRFLAHVKTHKAFGDWKRIVRKGYRNTKADEDESSYRNRMNRVYTSLLNGKSIIRYFVDFNERNFIGSWSLLEVYLKEVRKMNEDRITAIKNLGDRISDYIQQTNNIKRISQLERTRNYYTLRNLLRIIEKDMIKEGVENPLFTFDDYVTLLFPEGSREWRETLDLLLFRIYEKLHKFLLESPERETVIQEEEVDIE